MARHSGRGKLFGYCASRRPLLQEELEKKGPDKAAWKEGGPNKATQKEKRKKVGEEREIGRCWKALTRTGG